MPQPSASLVPIDQDCTISHRLRARGLRATALPFDWNVTPLASAVALLEDDFATFLLPDSLVYLPPVPRMLFDESNGALKISNEIITPVLCRRHGILFPHDFSARGRDEFDAVREKYQRRIERLRALLASDAPIRFLAHSTRLHDWQHEQYRLAAHPAPTTELDALNGLFARLQKRWPRARCQTLADFEAELDRPSFWRRVKRFLRRR